MSARDDGGRSENHIVKGLLADAKAGAVALCISATTFAGKVIDLGAQPNVDAESIEMRAERSDEPRGVALLEVVVDEAAVVAQVVEVEGLHQLGERHAVGLGEEGAGEGREDERNGFGQASALDERFERGVVVVAKRALGVIAKEALEQHHAALWRDEMLEPEEPLLGEPEHV